MLTTVEILFRRVAPTIPPNPALLWRHLFPPTGAAPLSLIAPAVAGPQREATLSASRSKSVRARQTESGRAGPAGPAPPQSSRSHVLHQWGTPRRVHQLLWTRWSDDAILSTDPGPDASVGASAHARAPGAHRPVTGRRGRPVRGATAPWEGRCGWSPGTRNCVIVTWPGAGDIPTGC